MGELCLVCSSICEQIEDSQLKINQQMVKYHVCSKCGYTFKDKTVHLSLHNEKIQYDYHQNSADNQGYVDMLSEFVRITVSPYKTSGNALDFGCGPGPVLNQILDDLGFITTVYDPIYYDNQAVFNQKYQLITSTEVFEHLFDPLKTLDKLAHLLEENGILAVMTKLRPVDNETFLSWWYRRDPTHVGFFTPKSLIILAKKCNLKILYTNNINMIVFKRG